VEQLEAGVVSGAVPGCSAHPPVDGGLLGDEPVMGSSELGD